MKFRFCGDLDCPDWILAEIATISKMSSIKAKQLCSLTVNSILNNENLKSDRIEKFASDSKLEQNDIKACVALIEFVLTMSTKHSTNSETLSSELQQLGLPKEHATAMCRIYEENEGKLEEFLRKSSLRLNNLVTSSWRIDYTFGSCFLKVENEPIIHLKLNVNSMERKRVDSNILTLDKTKLKLLIHELKEAKSLMHSLNETDLVTSSN